MMGGDGTEFQAVISEFTNMLYRPPHFLIEETQKRIQNLKELSKTEFKYFNDYLARLDSFKETR